VHSRARETVASHKSSDATVKNRAWYTISESLVVIKRLMLPNKSSETSATDI
jgi:hypothetical protein